MNLNKSLPSVQRIVTWVYSLLLYFLKTPFSYCPHIYAFILQVVFCLQIFRSKYLHLFLISFVLGLHVLSNTSSSCFDHVNNACWIVQIIKSQGCSFFYPTTSALMDTVIFLSTLFSNTSICVTYIHVHLHSIDPKTSQNDCRVWNQFITYKTYKYFKVWQLRLTHS
jgi:hypothetical protein